MAKNLEARLEKLEAEEGDRFYGLAGGRQLAKLGGYEGEELERMAKFFAGQPYRTHEEWVDLLRLHAGGQSPL